MSSICHQFVRHHLLSLVVLLVLSSSALGKCLGMVTAGGGVDFWTKVGLGASQAGVDLGFEVVVRGPTDESNSEMQQKIVEHMVNLGCIGLAVAPNSPERLTQLRELSDKGIHSVLVDRNFDSNEFSVIKTDNYSAGVKAAEHMLAIVPSGTNIAVIRLSSDVSSTSERERGFIDTIRTSNSKIVLDDYIGTSRIDAPLNAYQLLNQRADINAIFTPNESTTLAVLNTRKRLNNKMAHIGFDSHPIFLQAIKEHALSGIIVQEPFQMGYMGIQALVQLLKGEDINLTIETPVSFVSN